jgi:ubiquinone/menaquinone biosynthesis C-methylase UbiE
MSGKSDASWVRGHFDEISDEYDRGIPPQVRQHLVDKWWTLVSAFIPEGSKAIDLGCGDGTHVAFLRERGVHALGVDFSAQLIRSGMDRRPELRRYACVGDILRTPYPDESFDVGIVTGVLHHIHSRADQEAAIREGLRILRPGGRLIIRESNLFNPLFRFYWNYVFPLVAPIDRFGGESWIPDRWLRKVFGEAVERVDYFTFVPASTPPAILPSLARVERRLERSPLKRLSAHYIAVLRKPVPALRLGDRARARSSAISGG